MRWGGRSCSSLPSAAQCLTTGTGQQFDPETETLIPTFGGGFDVAVFNPNQITSKANRSQPSPGLCHTLPAASVPTIAFGWQNSAAQGDDVRENCAPTLDKSKTPAVMVGCYNGAIDGDIGATLGTRGSSVNSTGPTLMQGMAVRRLTPRECERLQGFPDDFTRIPWKAGYWSPATNPPEVIEAIASECPDGPRYKALGNSMAVPVMRWIGERINQVRAIDASREAA